MNRPPRNDRRPWEADTVADIEAGVSVHNADRVRELFDAPLALNNAICDTLIAVGAAEWHEARRQLELALHLVAVMEVLYPDGAEAEVA